MTLYNFTNITNSNSTLQIVEALNLDFTGGWFIILFLIALTVILLINYTAGEFKETFLAVSFMMVLITGLFFIAGLVPVMVIIFALFMMIIALGVFFIS